MFYKHFILIFATGMLFTFNAICEEKPVPPAEKNSISTVSQVDQKIWDFIPNVVARVGEKKITRKQELFILNKMALNSGKQPSEEQARQMALSLTDRLIRDIILAKLAAADGYKVKDKTLKFLDKEFEDEYTDTQRECINGELSKYNFSIRCNKYEAELRTVLTLWGKNKLAPKISVSEVDARNYYESHKESNYKIIETLAPYMILVKASDASPKAWADAEDKAEKIFDELKKGTNFTELAKKYDQSCNPDKSKAIGSFTKNSTMQPGPEFQVACWELATENSNAYRILKVKNGYAIVKVKIIQRGGYIPYEEVSDSIKRRLRIESVASVMHSMVDEQMKIIKPEIYLK